MTPVKTERPGEGFDRLIEIVATLRSPGGCPWDREQTPRTIIPYLIEEAYEAVEAIEADDSGHLCEELGDLLLEVALLARMAEEAGRFTAADTLASICGKLVRRHPHVFEGAEAADPDAVNRQWSRIKAAEKPRRGTLEGVPRSLPALHRARRVSEKAASVGFDWKDALGVLGKVEEECAELRQALGKKDREAAEEELGDLLFALVNLGRHLGVDAEAALHRTTEKFLRRFSGIEAALAEQGRKPADADAEEMEELWQKTKAKERS